MAYRNKTYVSFDGDSDIHYYRLMQAWKQNDRTQFDFYNAHDLSSARDTSTEESIKKQLSLRMASSKVFVILIGERTRYLYKFVRWEIEQALDRNLPVIAVNLNGLRYIDENRCPPILRDRLAVHISFNASIMQHALENWPASHCSYQVQNKSGPYFYKEFVYNQLGL
ncbi:MAG: TIR domain-containing protein [Proteobacteria bacterium]|nr:TIR domain-containing protein [Pseudomonadota bacterium]MBU2467326.1 TIR domain-containing protein [Pseudomonadota bacterium]